MIIDCPECSTSFHVPADLPGLDGHTVRCSRCQHQWRCETTMDKKKEIPSKIDIDETLPILEESGDAIAVIDSNINIFIDKKFIAVSFIVFLLLTIIFSLLFPIKIIRNYPQVYPIYKALKLVSSPIVINPIDVMYRKDSNGKNILYIELELENITDKKQTIPPLQVELYKTDGSLLKNWQLPAKGNEISNHAEIIIKFGLRNTPLGGERIVIRRNLKKIYGINDSSDNIDKKIKHEDGGFNNGE